MFKRSIAVIIILMLAVIIISCAAGSPKPGTGGRSSARQIEKTDHPNVPEGVSCYVCHKHDIPRHEFHIKYSNRCSECHVTMTWMAQKYPHPEWRLDEIHNVRCTRCHTKSNEHNFTYYQCYGCHHEEAAIKKSHAGLNVKDISGCITCHKSSPGI